MSKFINACCITAALALLFASCSTVLPNRNNNEIESDEELSYFDSLYLVQDIFIQAEPEPETVPEIDFFITEEIGNELITSDSTDSYDAGMGAIEPTDEIEQFFFNNTQSQSVALAEYKNIAFENIALDLRKENSCYPANGHVTSPYGWRNGRMHAGTDIKAQVGDNIYAAFDGVVRLAKYYGAYGNCLVIRHYNGLETVYGHATKLLVKVNDVVKAGDVIAYAGSTGRSTGSHLHFEVRVNGNHISPTYILDTDNRKIKDTTLFVTMRNGRIFASNNESEQAREAQIIQDISIRYYTVKNGDNLSTIASKNGTTVTTLCRLNGISSTSILRIGQRLIVRDGVKTATTKTTTPTTSQSATTPTSTASTTKSTASTTTPKTTNKATTTYTVKKGDTLGKIAKQTGTSISDICSLSGVTERTTLQIGQRLTVYGTGSNASVSSSKSTSSSSSSSQATTYTVKKGDTLEKIAKSNKTTISEICRLSGITERTTLQIGQRLTLRSSGSNTSNTKTATTTSSQATYHNVKSGDSLSKIAQKYNTTIENLCTLNNITRQTTLQIDQRLRVK